MKYIGHSLSKCVCCALLGVNGEVTGCEYFCGESHTATLLSFPDFCEEGEKIQDIYIKVEEPWFSWDGCVGCGSDLGGDRFTGTVYVG